MNKLRIKKGLRPSFVATLAALARDGKIEASVVDQAIKAHNINPEKSNPAIS